VKSKTIRIGTRASELALWQAHFVRDELAARHPGLTVEIEKIKTTGDKILDVPLARVGGKGLFVKEIETALEEDRVDIAVHSMKDVPTELPAGLAIVAMGEREDPRDALISLSGVKLTDLPQGAKVGTSSLRRQAQLHNLRPDLVIESLRGNVHTRLRKLREGQYDAIILAYAAVKRLGWADEVAHQVISEELSLPAIGQGALGIEARLADAATLGLISFFNHRETFVRVSAERALLHRMEGGCQVPIAAFATLEGDRLRLRGLVSSVDGGEMVRRERSGPASEPEKLGVALAEEILEAGGRSILEEVYQREIT
jgi:hydroxymethylbilane synthase